MAFEALPWPGGSVRMPRGDAAETWRHRRRMVVGDRDGSGRRRRSRGRRRRPRSGDWPWRDRSGKGRSSRRRGRRGLNRESVREVALARGRRGVKPPDGSWLGRETGRRNGRVSLSSLQPTRGGRLLRCKEASRGWQWDGASRRRPKVGEACLGRGSGQWSRSGSVGDGPCPRRVAGTLTGDRGLNIVLQGIVSICVPVGCGLRGSSVACGAIARHTHCVSLHKDVADRAPSNEWAGGNTHVAPCSLERVTLGSRGAQWGHGVVFLLGLQAGAACDGDLSSPRRQRQAVWLLGGAGVEAHGGMSMSMRWLGSKVLMKVEREEEWDGGGFKVVSTIWVGRCHSGVCRRRGGRRGGRGERAWVMVVAGVKRVSKTETSVQMAKAKAGRGREKDGTLMAQKLVRTSLKRQGKAGSCSCSQRKLSSAGRPGQAQARGA